MTTSPDHPGSRYSYIFHRCRCAACTAANSAYQKDYLRRRRLAGVTDKHGKLKEDRAFT